MAARWKYLVFIVQVTAVCCFPLLDSTPTTSAKCFSPSECSVIEEKFLTTFHRGRGSNGISAVDVHSDMMKRTTTERVPPGPFGFIPEYEGGLRPTMQLSWKGKCFKNNTASLTVVDATTVEMHMVALEPETLTCYDSYLLANVEAFYFKFFFFHGEHKMTFSGISAEEMEDIKAKGMRIFLLDESLLATVEDIVRTALLFKGPWTKQESLDFVKEAMGITYEKRDYGYIDIPEDQIPDGTYLATQRFDGSEVMIQYGTGSYSGHSTMAIRINGSLHVCESTGKNSPDYWPPPYGVICHPWKTWIQLARQADYSVSLMPLNAEMQKKFNNANAVKFIDSVLGLPYGFHNFIWGWMDTAEDNYPPPLTASFLNTALAIFDKIDQYWAQSVYTDGLNKRLKTECQSVECIMDNLIQKNLTLEEVFVIPEQDDWIYSDGRSMVCDVFVLEVWKAAGVFDVNFQATEFTPKDLYTLGAFDPNGKKAQCPNDGLPVCQIMGSTVMQFPGWNTIKPYANMCEKCPSLPPNYDRTPNC